MAVLKVSKADVWHGEIADQPGGLDNVLGALADAGANLDCVIARRQPENPGTGIVFITPVKGRKVVAAAQGVGLSPAQNIATLRIEGPNKAGMGRKVTEAISTAGINLRGLSAAVIGTKFVAYLAFDSVEDAGKASRALRAAK
jgi:hypothetical protein